MTRGKRPAPPPPITADERVEILDKAHRYLAGVYTGLVKANDPAQIALLNDFFPRFNQLIFDGAVLTMPPSGPPVSLDAFRSS